MPEDKIIKSGQFKLSRLLFLGACALVMYVIVGYGHLNIGYLLLTAVLCVLLGLVMVDYGVNMEKIDLTKSPVQAAAGPVAPVPGEESAADRAAAARRRTSRPVKRRR